MPFVPKKERQKVRDATQTSRTVVEPQHLSPHVLKPEGHRGLCCLSLPRGSSTLLAVLPLQSRLQARWPQPGS